MTTMLVLEKNSQEKLNEQHIIKKIKAAQPHILWLGIGSPKQVELASRWRQHLPNTTIICVGAAFNLLTGQTSMCPAWLQRLGLEWLFRLVVEPQRLWRRYVFQVPSFILELLWHRFLRRVF